jgi:glyoxylase-like metal-dependent hydrolase (beta-lactamase superfamily II)
MNATITRPRGEELMKTRPLLTAAAATIMSGLFGASTAMSAAASPQGSEGPGFYRLHVGDFEITALSDGTVLAHTGKRKEPQATPVNGFLINTGEKLVLIDTGAGTLLGPGVGSLIDTLRAAGYQPGQVDEIYLTDMLPDHIGGLVSERKAAFPGAIVHASRVDADYWLGRSFMATVPLEERQRFAAVGAALKPYMSAGRFKTFDGTDLGSAIRALPCVGPTPGPTVFVAESRGEKIVFLGDDGVDAAMRIGAFKEPAANGYWVAGVHRSFPGIGHLRAARHGVEWMPSKKATY